MIGRWEICEVGGAKPFAERVHVTLNRRNIFCLNAKVFEMLGRPEAVQLLFDKKELVIGLNPAPMNTKGTFRVQPHTNGGTHRIIHAALFCRQFNIMMDGTSAFLDPRLDNDGVLLLDLKAIMPARSRRKPKANRYAE